MKDIVSKPRFSAMRSEAIKVRLNIDFCDSE